MSPEETLDAYHAALRRHDLDAAMALIDREAVFLFSNGAAHPGADAVRAAFAHNFEAIRDDTYHASRLRWIARSESAAACVFEYHWSGQIAGQPASGSGRGTLVLRRAPGEPWRIVHEHLSRGDLGGGE